MQNVFYVYYVYSLKIFLNSVLPIIIYNHC